VINLRLHVCLERRVNRETSRGECCFCGNSSILRNTNVGGRYFVLSLLR